MSNTPLMKESIKGHIRFVKTRLGALELLANSIYKLGNQLAKDSIDELQIDEIIQYIDKLYDSYKEPKKGKLTSKKYAMLKEMFAQHMLIK